MRRNDNHFSKKIHVYKKTVGSTDFEIPISMAFDGKDVTYWCETNGVTSKTSYRISHKAGSLKEIVEYIENALVDIAPIKWEPMIRITVEGKSETKIEADKRKTNRGLFSDNDLIQTQIRISSEYIEIGTDPSGRKWERDPERKTGWVQPFYKDAGKRVADGWNNAKVTSYIPDTPENRDKLMAFAGRFDLLLDAFFKAMMPKNIEKFLTQNTRFQLTAGKK